MKIQVGPFAHGYAWLVSNLDGQNVEMGFEETEQAARRKAEEAANES